MIDPGRFSRLERRLTRSSLPISWILKPVADIRDDDVLERLAECRDPFLIGVRHHSAALARVIPRLLADRAPESVLIELPPEFQPWLEYLGRDDLEAPVALAACDQTHMLSFYPLADFSPELAAIRWAAKHHIPVIPCDLGLRQMHRLDRLERDKGHRREHDPDRQTALGKLLNRFAVRDTGELWEKLVEAAATSSSPEAIRRAALFFGWMVRHSSQEPSLTDAHREAAMRAAVAAAPRNSVAIVGSYHAAALLPEPMLWSAPEPAGIGEEQFEKPVTSLIAYSFAQLDDAADTRPASWTQCFSR